MGNSLAAEHGVGPRIMLNECYAIRPSGGPLRRRLSHAVH